MKFTLSWLKDHLDTKRDRRGDRRQLTMHRPRGRGASTIRRQRSRPSPSRSVLQAEQHPNADQLQVCQVDTGNGACRSCAARPTRAPA